MLQEDLRHHGRRAPQMHPHPVPDTDAASSTSTPPSSITSIMSTTSSAGSSTTSSTTTETRRAVFVYPTALLTLNNIDVVQVSYKTIWDSINLTVFCEISPHSNEFALARINQIQPNGTYAIAPIQAGMQIPQFPTYCNFMLGNAEDSTDYTTGAGFTMVSTQGVATTYALAATYTAPAPTQSPISTASHRGTTQTSASTGAAVSSSTASGTALSSTSQSNVLSSGAKAGITIGVILGVSALIAVVVFMRLRRRVEKLEHMVTLRSAASSVNTAPLEKIATAEPAAKSPPLAPSPSPPPGGCGPRIEVFKIGESHRNSEDWRRFFGNAKS